MRTKLFMYFTVMFMLILGITGFTQEATIMKADCGIDLDGYADDLIWDQVTAHNIDLPYEGDTDPPTLTSATWKAFWNDTAVFVLLEVSEDSWQPSWISGDPDWMSDKPEVYFDVNETLLDGNAPLPDGMGEGNGHYQLAPNFTEETGTTSPGDLIVVHDGEKFYAANRYTPSPTTYSFEYSAAFESLVDEVGTALDPATRTSIGFDVTIVDRDEGEDVRKRAVWANNVAPESWNDLDGAGIIHFSTSKLGCPSSDPAYNDNDSIALRTIDNICDVNNNLNWDTETDPANWDGVSWDNSYPKRVVGLSIDDMDLTDTLNLSALSNLVLMNCQNNQLTGINVSGLTSLDSLNCANNRLTLASLPEVTGFNYFNYNPQDSLFSAEVHNSNVTLDYAAHAAVGDSLTTFSFYKDSAVVETNTTGIFNTLGRGVYQCTMTNGFYPGLTLATRPVTIDMPEQYHADDSSALVSIDNNCDNNDNLNWDNETDPGNWDGVTWNDDYPRRVSELAIADIELSGELDVSELSALEKLECNNNQLSDIDIATLAQLNYLDCSNNKLSFSTLPARAIDEYHYNPQDSLFDPKIYDVDVTLNYSAHSFVGDSATTFLFYKNNEPIDINYSGKYTTSGPGVYHCELTNNYFPELTLITSTTTIQEEPTGITSVREDQIKVYPNPTSGQVNIRIMDKVEDGDIVVYAMNGKQLYQEKWYGTTTMIDLSGLEEGVYLLQIHYGDTMETRRIKINK